MTMMMMMTMTLMMMMMIIMMMMMMMTMMMMISLSAASEKHSKTKGKSAHLEINSSYESTHKVNNRKINKHVINNDVTMRTDKPTKDNEQFDASVLQEKRNLQVEISCEELRGNMSKKLVNTRITLSCTLCTLDDNREPVADPEGGGHGACKKIG